MTGDHDTLVTLDISGMTCAACAARLERVLSRQPGVRSARVSLPLERADISITPPVARAELIAAVESAGFHGVIRGATTRERDRQRQARNAQRQQDHRRTQRLALLAGAIALPFLLDMVRMMLTGDHSPGISPWLQAALAMLAQVACGARFYRGAWSALRGGSANMDVLVALGTTAALGLSLFNLLTDRLHHGGGLYFEASVTVLAFLLLGKVLEGLARSGASATLEALAAGAPRQAVRVVGGLEAVVAASSLKPGDTVLVRPGAQAPADGRVSEGNAAFDEALITGESLPVAKTVGDPVIAGAIASGGSVLVEVLATGDDTRLQRIARLIEDAEIAKSPSQQMADRISAVFVPAVIAVSILTAAAWVLIGAGTEQAIIHAVSVLVVACPCALGLATPIALVAGANAAARTGIVISDYGALEAAAGIGRVVFDKTGTLTEGRPGVSAFVTTVDERRALALAAALGSRSDHPLDRAIVARASEAGLALPRVEAFVATPGSGLTGKIDGARYWLGNAAFITGAGTQTTHLAALLDEASVRASSSLSILASDNAGVIAIIGFADAPRPEVAQLLAELQRLGIPVTVLSGDRQLSVDAFARRFRIADARGGLTPDAKIRLINEMRQGGVAIAMVGDGINDAPALRAADIGIAMSSGTEAAKAAAAVTLARPDLTLVATAIAAGRATRTTIIQNLALAFLFNSVGIPMAAIGQLSPSVAGAAMAGSSVSVVLNSWRLARKRMSPARTAESRPAH